MTIFTPMTTLNILREDRQDRVLLVCSGRLDATSTDHLSDYMERLVREGKYHVALDLSGVDYLSSAGIRVLLMQHRNLQALNGRFHITALSDNVRQVLEMVGMAQMFTSQDQQAVQPEKKNAPAEIRSEAGDYSFYVNVTDPDANTTISCMGDPNRIGRAAYTADDTRTVTSAPGKYAFGLGAIGDSFHACSERFGEYVLLNGTAAYLPSDGSKKPDYMISHGQLTARLAEVYGLHFSAPFSHRILFEPTGVDFGPESPPPNTGGKFPESSRPTARCS